jgi:hypothetical protein
MRNVIGSIIAYDTEDSMQCSLVPDDLLTVQNLPQIGVPKR